MKRRTIFASLAAVAVSGSMAVAQDLVAGITAQLRDQGFRQIEVSRTLLGRTRIVAHSDKGEREIILNPNTGEILRDLWEPDDDTVGGSQLVNTHEDQSGNGSGTAAPGSDASGTGSGGSGKGDGGTDSGANNSSDSDDSGSGDHNDSTESGSGGSGAEGKDGGKGD